MRYKDIVEKPILEDTPSLAPSPEPSSLAAFCFSLSLVSPFLHDVS